MSLNEQDVAETFMAKCFSVPSYLLSGFAFVFGIKVKCQRDDVEVRIKIRRWLNSRYGWCCFSEF